MKHQQGADEVRRVFSPDNRSYYRAAEFRA
jgi:hypothetical protein